MKNIDKLMRSFIVELGEESIVSFYDRIPQQGKKLRSKLIFEIAKDSESSFNLAAVIEMIHTASLLHDDVIDDALTRRNANSFNADFGDKSAIMMGDILYSCAFSRLTLLPQSVAESVSKAVASLSAGELLDVELSKSFNTDKERYFKMIYCKTASLIEAASYSAAVLEGFEGRDFALYGKNLGLAFQIIDDVLDITSSDKMLGKPALNDFKEGKVTLPYLYMYEKCKEKDKKHMASLHKKSLNSYENAWIKDKMDKYNIVELCIKEAMAFGVKALSAIEKYNMNGLNNIVRQMVERDF
ncbi:MAG: polyprenyl synthetase family protein [Campylobacteraceae bacterium]|jgi:octaprenyl-diphosphate synthase|nr:polyprenyl synthetase family protein [Campylobacteraceae bacterium]